MATKYASSPNTYLSNQDLVTSKVQLSRGLILSNNLLSVVQEWQTWTPTPSVSVAGFDTTGSAYRRIGNIVSLNVNLAFTYSGGGTTTTLAFGGLPLTITGTTNFGVFSNVVSVYNATTDVYYVAQITSVSDSAFRIILPSEFQDGEEYLVQGIYEYQHD